MKVIFMGTPEFAAPSLEALMKQHEVVAVVTQPDRPKGRGKKLAPPIIKEKALEYGIPVLQPERVRNPEVLLELKKYNPDILVVVAFGQILPEEMLSFPKYGAVNVHGSLLPKYRGAAPMQWAVLNGDAVTGITTMHMAKGLDSGDMILKSEVPLADGETYGSLHDKMAVCGAETLLKTLSMLEDGTAPREAQREEDATYAPMMTKELERIDWSRPSDEIIWKIRGLSPAPGAFSVLKEENIKIWRAEKAEEECDAAPGTVVAVSKKDFTVKTGDSALRILEVQGRGGKRMAADAYMRGHSICVGDAFSV